MFSKILKESESINSIIAAIIAVIVATGALHSISMNIMFPGSIYLLNASDMINMAITGLPITINVVLIISPLIYLNYSLNNSEKIMKISTLLFFVSHAPIAIIFFSRDNYSNVETGAAILLSLSAQSFLISTISKKFKSQGSSLSGIAYFLPFLYLMISSLIFYILNDVIKENSNYFKVGDSFVCTETCERGDIISSLGEFVVVEYESPAVISYVRREDIKKHYIVPRDHTNSEKPIPTF